VGAQHYELRYLHDGRITRFAFDGEALLPEAVSPDGPVRFELVTHGHSNQMLLDPLSGRVSSLDGPLPEPPTQRPSPNGKLSPLRVLRRSAYGQQQEAKRYA
jgi:hypothetical protein